MRDQKLHESVIPFSTTMAAGSLRKLDGIQFNVKGKIGFSFAKSRRIGTKSLERISFCGSPGIGDPCIRTSRTFPRNTGWRLSCTENGITGNCVDVGFLNLEPASQNLKTDSSSAAIGNTVVKDSADVYSKDDVGTSRKTEKTLHHESVEEWIEKAIFNCRFLTLMAVAGSLAGSILCFLKGCTFVYHSFKEYFHTYMSTHGSGKVILLLVEAVDVYLMGTVMLIFGMGLYELFVNSLEIPDRDAPKSQASRATVCGSNLFGLFRLQERPKWLEIQSLDELKTKLGHVIVMVLLVGMFEKSKKVPINTGVDLLCFSGSVLFASGGLFLLSKLNFGK